MTSHAIHSPANRAFKSFAILLACVPLMAMAQTHKSTAAPPSLAGPSLVQASKGAVFTGQGYKPNSAVSIALRTPAGVESHFSTVVAADGSLSYRIDSRPAGSYSLKVVDTSGKALASTNFHVVQ